MFLSNGFVTVRLNRTRLVFSEVLCFSCNLEGDPRDRTSLKAHNEGDPRDQTLPLLIKAILRIRPYRL